MVIAVSLHSRVTTGVWTPTPGCFIPTLENGWVETQDSVGGDSWVGRFRCQAGFVLSGASTVKCRKGVWSVRPDNFPLCAAIGSCDAETVPRIRNGFQKANRKYKNSVYRYSCNAGYRLLGVSTVFCTQAGWSARDAPVCTRPGCDVQQLVGAGLKYGRARTVRGGAAVRFSCNAGATMEGSALVFCDGKKWNGTRPECLVPPGPPSLYLSVDGAMVQNPSVAPGINVTISCQGGGGNPVPSLALYIGGERVQYSTDSTIQYSTTVQNSVQVYCTAHNTMVQSPVQSQVQLIRLQYPPTHTYLQGPSLVTTHQSVQYSCSSDQSDPPPYIHVTVTDHNGEAVKTEVEKLPLMRGRKGFAAKVRVGIKVEDHIKTLHIECKAVNKIGEAVGKMRTQVQYAPETVHITGATLVKDDDERVEYSCSSDESYPEPTIVWNKIVEGNVEIIEEDEIELETVDTGVGVVKTSKLTIFPKRVKENSFLLFCLVKVPKLKFERSSEMLDILITSPPKRISIDGPDQVKSGEEALFKCDVEGGVPTPVTTLVVTDQYDTPLPTIPALVQSEHTILHVTCTASNSAGYVEATRKVPVLSPPSDVSISGPKYVKEGHQAGYMCISPVTYPPVEIHWRVWSDDTVEYVTDDTSEDDKDTKSHLTISQVSSKSLNVTCVATNTVGSLEETLEVEVEALQLEFEPVENNLEKVNDDKFVDHLTSKNETEENSYMFYSKHGLIDKSFGYDANAEENGKMVKLEAVNNEYYDINSNDYELNSKDNMTNVKINNEYPTDNSEYPIDDNEYPTDKNEYPTDDNEYPTDNNEAPTDNNNDPKDNNADPTNDNADSYKKSDIEEPTFLQSESESVHAALNLGDSQAQHVEISGKHLSSSSAKLDIKFHVIFVLFILTRSCL